MRQDKLDEAIAELRTVKRLEPNYGFAWPGSVQVDLLRDRPGLIRHSIGWIWRSHMRAQHGPTTGNVQPARSRAAVPPGARELPQDPGTGRAVDLRIDE